MIETKHLTKRERRKAVPCVICRKNDAWNRAGICWECLRVFNVGAQYLEEKDKAVQEGGFINVQIDIQHNFYSFDHDREFFEKADRHHLRDEISKQIWGALLAILEPFAGNSVRGEKAVYIGFSRDSSDRYYAPHYTIKAAFLEPLKTLLTGIVNLAEYNYREGKRDGSHFLNRLIRNEVTIEELNTGKNPG